jgi:hypothetical protein
VNERVGRRVPCTSNARRQKGCPSVTELPRALNGRQPHVVQDYGAAQGAQFPAHSKIGQREIEQMTSVHENNVKRSAWSAR